MKIRADIAELLHAGVPLSHICRQLHVATLTVQRTREALGLPAPKACRVLPATLEAAFQQHTRPLPDGHVEWTGHINGTAPQVTFQGTAYPARRLAFRYHHGREPIGKVLPAPDCEVRGCVAGPCLTDQQIRQANGRADALYAAIFGEAS